MDKNSTKKCIKKTTNIQFDFLIREMSKRPNAARGYGCGTKREKVDADWHEIVDQLNELGPPFRNLSEWKKVWSDLRKRLHNRLNNERSGRNVKRKFSNNEKIGFINNDARATKTKLTRAAVAAASTTTTTINPALYHLAVAATNEYNERQDDHEQTEKDDPQEFSDNFFIANHLKREESLLDGTSEDQHHSSLNNLQQQQQHQQQQYEQMANMAPNVDYDKVFLYTPEQTETETDDYTKRKYFNNNHNNNYNYNNNNKNNHNNNNNNNSIDYIQHTERMDQLKQANQFYEHLTKISSTLSTLMERQIHAIEKQNITLERQAVAMEKQTNTLTSLMTLLDKKFNANESKTKETALSDGNNALQ